MYSLFHFVLPISLSQPLGFETLLLEGYACCRIMIVFTFHHFQTPYLLVNTIA